MGFGSRGHADSQMGWLCNIGIHQSEKPTPGCVGYVRCKRCHKFTWFYVWYPVDEAPWDKYTHVVEYSEVKRLENELSIHRWTLRRALDHLKALNAEDALKEIKDDV